MVRLFRHVAILCGGLFGLAALGLVWKLLDPGALALAPEMIALLAFALGGSAAGLLFMSAVTAILDDARNHLAALSRAVVRSFEEAKAEAEQHRAP